MEQQSTPGPGHNQPPQPLDATQVLDWLEPWVAPLRTRKAALLAAVERFRADHVPIRDDDQQGNAAEFTRQLRAFIKAAEDLRDRLGKPYRDCTITLNSAFKRLEAEVIEGRETVSWAMTTYARDKAAAERQRREAEAAEANRLAELARTQARSGVDPAAWDRAVDTTLRAEVADRQANAGQADLSRVRGDQGAVASLRENLDWEVIDIDKVPRLFMELNRTAVRLAIAGGAREIEGLRIFDASKVAVR